MCHSQKYLFFCNIIILVVMVLQNDDTLIEMPAESSDAKGVCQKPIGTTFFTIANMFE